MKIVLDKLIKDWYNKYIGWKVEYTAYLVVLINILYILYLYNKNNN